MTGWPEAPTLAVCGTKRLCGDPNRHGFRHMQAAGAPVLSTLVRLSIGSHDASRRNPGQFVGFLVLGGERVAIRAGRTTNNVPLAVPGATGGGLPGLVVGHWAFDRKEA